MKKGTKEKHWSTITKGEIEKVANPVSPQILAENARPLPTPTELAHLAVSLVAGHPPGFTWRHFAANALDLWEACYEELSDRTKKRDVEKLAVRPTPIPTPTQYPIDYEVFLSLLMPRKSQPDRNRIFRHFIIDTFSESEYIDNHNYIPDIGQIPTPDEFAEKSIGDSKKYGLTEGQYRRIAPKFIRWFDLREANNRKLQAREAAKKRWTEEKTARKRLQKQTEPPVA